MTEPEVLEYTVRSIGGNTLIGMLVRFENGKHSIDDIRGKIVVANYEECFLDPAGLANDLHWLYQHGAAEVRLVQWVPERQREFGGRLVTIPRHKKERS